MSIYTTSERYALQTGSYNAGYDLYPLNTVVIKPSETIRVSTGEQILVGQSNVGLIFPRSSSHGKILVNTGVVDGGYKGKIMMSLTNYGEESITIHKDQSPAQFIVMPISQDKIIHVQEAEFMSLKSDDRGENGFGSTGSKIV